MPLQLCLIALSQFERLTETEEKIGKTIVNAAFQIHKEQDPGLLEKVYEVCFAHVLRKNGFDVKRQVAIPIHSDGLEFEEGLKLDLLVNDSVIVELEALDNVNPVWQAQLLSHLKLTGNRLG